MDARLYDVSTALRSLSPMLSLPSGLAQHLYALNLCLNIFRTIINASSACVPMKLFS